MTFFFKIIGLIMAYFVMLLITKKFGSEVFGRYSIAITFSHLLVLIFTFGMPSAIIRLLSDEESYKNVPKTNFLKKTMLTTLFSSVVISVVLFFSSDFLGEKVFHDSSLSSYFKTLSFFIVPLMFHEVFLNYYRGIKQFRRYNVFMFVLPPLFYIILFYGLFLLNYQTEIITILSLGLSILIVFIFELIGYRFLTYNTKINYSTRKLLKISFPMMLSGTILFLLNWTDIFMLGAMVSSKDVGIYNLAFKIASVGLLIIVVVNVVIGPKIAELYSKNDFDELRITVVRSTQTIALLTLPITLILVIFSEQILGFFGTDFYEGKTTLLILSFGVLINAISGNVDQVLNMTDNQIVLRNLTLFCLIINIVLNFILIPAYGIKGAAIASVVTNIFLNILSIYFIKKKLGFFTFM